MKLFEEVTLIDSIVIDAPPEKVYGFITGLIDDPSYQAWHKDHVSMEWLAGEPWQEGSIAQAKEYLHGKLHTLIFKATKIIPNQLIEYIPANWLLRRYFPKNSFIFEKTEGGTCFTATCQIRAGWVVRTFFRKQMKKGVEATKIHMKEEGENLKKILEANH